MPLPIGLAQQRRSWPGPARDLRVVMAASEMTPIAKVGGLGDVVGALSRELVREGQDVTVILPAYREVLEGSWDLERQPLAPIRFPYGEETAVLALWRLFLPGSTVRVLLLEDPRVSARSGIYTDPRTGQGHSDEADRDARFCRGILELLPRIDLVPDVLHLHDHQTALLPTLLRRARRGTRFFRPTRTLLTLHNVAYQGIHDASVLDRVGLGREEFHPGGKLEFWGRTNFLKAGLLDAEMLTTVSPRHALEIVSGPEFGFGLEGVLQDRAGDLVGILNGLDEEAWDPARDPHLERTYDAGTLEGRERNRAALLESCGLDLPTTAPVAGIISRLVEQKGMDLVRGAAAELLSRGVGLVVLGSGQKNYEAFFRRLAGDHPRQVFYSGAFDDPLAHRIVGGADLFLMPSRFEPCGLGQMMAMKYGCIPVARRTGGLADTIQPVGAEGAEGTGFLFDEYSPGALLEGLDRALVVFRDAPRWRALMARAMGASFSWGEAGRRYLQLYRRLCGGAGGPG